MTRPAAAVEAMGRQLQPLMPARIGRAYSEGTIATSNLWTDDEPVHLASGSSQTAPAAYEIRWWAVDRYGTQDDVVADVLEYSTEARAREALTRASSPRCRSRATARLALRPPGAASLFWVNPDRAQEWDVLLARGRRLYRVVDAPPQLGEAGASRNPLSPERMARTVEALACRLPGGACVVPPAASETDLAPLTGSAAARAGATITTARAAAYARAINLQAYDVPGLAQIAPSGAESDRADLALARCAGMPVGTPARAAERSPFFGYRGRRQYEYLHSSVVLLPSEALADRYVSALSSTRARACVIRWYDGQLLRRDIRAHAGLRLGRVALTPLQLAPPPSLRGVAPYHAIGMRVTLPVQYTTRFGRHVTNHLYEDGFAFAYGGAVIELSAVSAYRPYSEASERYVLSALLGRAEQNQL